ncbi:MAG TPA: RNA polymerase subunit sigma [Planctomycetaceae bacterium]|nr:RNA polymerase subunit sigma [Planctomycetaceae bacterium]
MTLDTPVKAEQLLPLVYAQLKRIASRQVQGERSRRTLLTTALVHEAFLKLNNCRGREIQWASEEQFLGAAAKAMQRILVDHARARKRVKRGGGIQPLSLSGNEAELAELDIPDYLPDLDDAMQRLAVLEPTAAELVQLRFFGGLSISQAATTMGISPRSADRIWAFARAWLYRELHPAVVN